MGELFLIQSVLFLTHFFDSFSFEKRNTHFKSAYELSLLADTYSLALGTTTILVVLVRSHFRKNLIQF